MAEFSSTFTGKLTCLVVRHFKKKKKNPVKACGFVDVTMVVSREQLFFESSPHLPFEGSPLVGDRDSWGGGNCTKWYPVGKCSELGKAVHQLIALEAHVSLDPGNLKSEQKAPKEGPESGKPGSLGRL